jgi:hypothetical protein
MVEIARNNQIPRIAEEAGDTEATEAFQVESTIVDRRDAVRPKTAVEVLEMTVVMAIASAPGPAPIEDAIHDPAVEHRQALVVGTMNQMGLHADPQLGVPAPPVDGLAEVGIPGSSMRFDGIRSGPRGRVSAGAARVTYRRAKPDMLGTDVETTETLK